MEFTENQTEVHQALAQSIANMMDWASIWEISVNLAKTSVLHFGEAPNVEYRFEDIVLDKLMRDLGVCITIV